MEYVAFLRGINISGKNKISMADLKKHLELIGFNNVKTVLNSGNVLFEYHNDNKIQISNIIKNMILEKYGYDVPTYIIKYQELKDIMDNKPEWWGLNNKDIYDNIIFIMPQSSINEVHLALGKTKDEYEKVEDYKNIIFWSFELKNYKQTNWWSKTASSDIRNQITIRTYGTIKKVLDANNI